jgi:hypothetical protein
MDCELFGHAMHPSVLYIVVTGTTDAIGYSIGADDMGLAAGLRRVRESEEGDEPGSHEIAGYFDPYSAITPASYVESMVTTYDTLGKAYAAARQREGTWP